MADEKREASERTREFKQADSSVRSEKPKFLGMDRDKVKIAIGLLMLIGIITFVLQNLDEVAITFIWTLEISRAILYPGIFLAGALFGWIVKSLSMRQRKSKSS